MKPAVIEPTISIKQGPARHPGDWLECPMCKEVYVYSRRCRCGLYLVGRPPKGRRRVLPSRPFAIRQDDGTWDIYG